jgi:hypothetical protein
MNVWLVRKKKEFVELARGTLRERTVIKITHTFAERSRC